MKIRNKRETVCVCVRACVYVYIISMAVSSAQFLRTEKFFQDLNELRKEQGKHCCERVEKEKEEKKVQNQT